MPDLGLAIRAQVEKCPIPWVWLDTSVIIRIADFEAGRLTDPIQRDRIGCLKKSLEPLVASGRLICPEASQDDEIWQERKRFTSVLHRLSMGLVMKSRGGLEEAQTSTLMHAFIRGEREVAFSYRDALFRDPVDELRKVMSSGVIISVNRGLIEPADKVKSNKEKLAAGWEALRKKCLAKGVTYETQRELERGAWFATLVQMAGGSVWKAISGQDHDINETFAHLHINELVHEWNSRGGEPAGLRGLARFMSSNHFALQPFQDVASALNARLVTGTEPIQAGDIMDVEHIAGVLPYANLMIVDRKMKHYVQSLGLDKRYGTAVLHSGDVDELSQFLEEVGKREPVSPHPKRGHARPNRAKKGD
jgi:hypothetical protein